MLRYTHIPPDIWVWWRLPPGEELHLRKPELEEILERREASWHSALSPRLSAARLERG